MRDVLSLHREEYGNDPEVIVQAPGKVNLVGDHTDYNDGYMLPVAIDRFVQVGVSRRKDNSLRFFAADLSEHKRTSISNLKYKREDRWANYLKGVVSSFLQMGYHVGGIDVTISGDIPQGIGLSSSAAIEVALALGLKTMYEFSMKNMQIIQCASQAETSFMGRNSGIMDQFICSLGREGNAFFIDTRSMDYQYIPLDIGDLQILITDSRVPNIGAQSEYQTRVDECKECVGYLNAKKPGSALRDYSTTDLREIMGMMPEQIRKRCIHVIEENQRVYDAVEMLKKKDYPALGKILNRSHESLRDLYEVSCPEIDWLVKRAWETDGVYGSRMTGIGFGGCTITLIRERAIPEYRKRLDDYERIFGFKPVSFLCNPAAGAKVIYEKLTGPV